MSSNSVSSSSDLYIDVVKTIDDQIDEFDELNIL